MLLTTQTGLDSIAALTWREFEQLVGAAFRQQGYTVEETGQGGADGGIDLILRRGAAIEIVQCKRWRSRQVDVRVVREMFGLLEHHHAKGAKIVCVGAYTRDAEEFARGKSIELIAGDDLVALVRSAQASLGARDDGSFKSASSADPSCPVCSGEMLQRANRKTGELFWGCRRFPECRGTRALKT